jgi:hypothetical protein
MRQAGATVIDFIRARRKQQAEQQRRHAGRFTSGRSPAEILEIIREGVLLTAARFEREPERVHQHQFDRVRYELEERYGRVPEARELVRQLRKATDKPFQWRAWVAIALDESKDFKKVVEHLARPPAADVTPLDVTFALLTVVRELHGRND